MARAISSRLGSGLRSSRCLARSAIPGMQKPHCTPPAAAKARADDLALAGGEALEGQHLAAVGALAPRRRR